MLLPTCGCPHDSDLCAHLHALYTQLLCQKAARLYLTAGEITGSMHAWPFYGLLI